MSITAAEIRPVPEYHGFFATSDGEILYSEPGGSPQPVPVYTHGQSYAMIAINKSQSGKPQRMVTVHSLVLQAFAGPKPSPLHVARHLNGHPFDNRSANLMWGTAAENAQDSVRHGTCSTLRHGSRHPRAVLTEAQAIDALNQLAHGATGKSVATKLGVAPSTICYLRSGENWPHLDRTNMRRRVHKSAGSKRYLTQHYSKTWKTSIATTATSDQNEQHMNHANRCMVSSVKVNQDGVGTGMGVNSLGDNTSLTGPQSFTCTPVCRGGVEIDATMNEIKA